MLTFQHKCAIIITSKTYTKHIIKKEDAMGLDMYLYKMKRKEGVTINDIFNLDSYFDYLERKDKYKDSTCKEYCGIDEEDVRKELIPEYYKEYIPRYYAWDEDKKSPRTMLYENIAYWRKANAIHQFFVENVQDGEDNCETYEVSKDALEELLYRCKVITENCKLVDGKVNNGYTYKDGKAVPIIEDGKVINNAEKAEELLPTQGGFFFGSTDYDEYYMLDIEYTKETLEKILENADFDNYIYAYRASW